MEMEAWGQHANVIVVMPGIGCQLIVSRLGSVLVSSVIAIVAPLRHASMEVADSLCALCYRLCPWAPLKGPPHHSIEIEAACG